MAELNSLAAGVEIIGALDKIVDAGGEDADAAAVTLAALLAAGAVGFAPATKQQRWAGTAGFLQVTAEVEEQAWEPQTTIAPDVNDDIELDGDLFFRAVIQLADDSDFIAPLNLSHQARHVVLVGQAGAPTAVTATGFDRTYNFGTGVEIPAGKRAGFTVMMAGASSEIWFTGYQD